MILNHKVGIMVQIWALMFGTLALGFTIALGTHFGELN